MQFETLGIDIRLAKQLAHQAITEPTEIQQKSIPVVIASDQSAIPVVEQNKVQSEVALSLLSLIHI